MCRMMRCLLLLALLAGLLAGCVGDKDSVLGNAPGSQKGDGKTTTDGTAPSTTASPAAGTYTSAQSVTLTCTDNAGGSGCAATHYTTDGSTPTTASSTYSAPIAISASTTLKFFSRDVAGNAEAVRTAAYVINGGTGTTTCAWDTGQWDGCNWGP